MIQHRETNMVNHDNDDMEAMLFRLALDKHVVANIIEAGVNNLDIFFVGNR